MAIWSRRTHRMKTWFNEFYARKIRIRVVFHSILTSVGVKKEGSLITTGNRVEITKFWSCLSCNKEKSMFGLLCCCFCVGCEEKTSFRRVNYMRNYVILWRIFTHQLNQKWVSERWFLLFNHLHEHLPNNAIHLQLNGFFFECCVNIWVWVCVSLRHTVSSCSMLVHFCTEFTVL